MVPDVGAYEAVTRTGSGSSTTMLISRPAMLRLLTRIVLFPLAVDHEAGKSHLM